MPVGSFSLTQVIPELQASLIKYITDSYDETFGFSKIAKENKPQYEQKIRTMGKTYKRYVAADIPQRGKVPYIKDTKFTDDFKTAPEYGEGFTINTDDLMLNPQMPVNFNTLTKTGTGSRLSERVNMASQIVVNDIRRSEGMQVKNILETCTVALDNYTDVDFERDATLSTSITAANEKWEIANAATMDSFGNLDTWCETLATRGNIGGRNYIALVGDDAYDAHQNSDKYKADSDIRRNYKVEVRAQDPFAGNRNIPEGALYRESINVKTGVCHLYTYSQNYMVNDGSDTLTNWLDKDMVIILAPDNIIERQPVYIPNMLELMPMTPQTKALLRTVPNSSAWLVYPDWKECDMFTFAMAIKKQFLTMALTPNKIFSAIVNS